MIWQETPYTIPLLMVSALSATLGGYIWFRFCSPIGRTGAATILASTGWILTFTLRQAGGDLPTKIFWGKMQYPGIVLLPTAWFIFAIYYTGREKWLTCRTLLGFSIIPVTTLVLVFTNEYHGLIWSSFTVDATGPFLMADETFGVWLWGFVGYAYTLFLLGAFLFFIQVMKCSHPRYRRQTSILLFGGIVPWIASALVSFGLNPFPHLDLTMVALTMTNLVVAFNIFHFRLGDVVPLAREFIIESMDDSIIVLDTENNIIDVNLAAQHLIGYTASELKGKPVEEMWPEWSSTWGLSNVDSGSKEIVLEPEQRIYDVSISPVIDWRDRTVSRIVVLRDVTDRKRSEKIKQSLKEKEILLQEIHHRVKNNIQVISSLLKLQSYHIKDEKYKQMLKESQDRIMSMGLIHEKLYQSENLANVDFNEYVTDLVHTLFRSYGVHPEDIALKMDVDDVALGIGVAIPCGLIINELVSNSLKHAFSDKKGEINISLSSINETIELVVGDNGTGIPENIDFRNTESLGLHLVTLLAEGQLDGEIMLERSNGTTFHITFKKKK